MPGDIGDDFSEEIKRTVMEVIQFMRLSSLGGRSGGMPHNGSGLLGRFGNWLDDIDNRASEALAGENPPNSVETLERPDKIVIAKNVEDAGFLRSVMEQNNLEYSLNSKVTPEGTRDFIFRLPDVDAIDKASIHVPFSKIDHALIESDHPYTTLSEMAEINPEVISLLNHYGMHSDPAMIQMDGSKVSKVPFVKGAPENFKFDFKTVEWDRDAEILTAFFDEKGIPYTLEDLNHETVRFSFHPESAAQVKDVVDFHINNTELNENGYPKAVSKKRFLDYEALTDISKRTPAESAFNSEQPSTTSSQRPSKSTQVPLSFSESSFPVESRNEILSLTVDDAAQANVLKQCLSDEQIAFESFKQKGCETERFVLSKIELAQKADRLDAIEQRVNNMTDKEISKLSNQRAKAKSHGTKKGVNSKNVPNEKERGFSTNQNHSPIRVIIRYFSALQG